MTRVLANLLGVEQLDFRATIQKLEHIAGKPSKDIRLATEVARLSGDKIAELGLDPKDTTSQELYYALQERFKRDNDIVRAALSIESDANVIESTKSVVAYVQKSMNQRNEVLALKNAVARKLIKQQPPKKTMRQLGYRSLDSMIKHEAAAHIIAAAFLCESPTWQKRFTDQYAKLQAGDFEIRAVGISVPTASKWVTFANQVDPEHKVFSVRELGAVVVLPVQDETQELSLIASIINALNEVRSVSSYLKLQQVKPDFGAKLQAATVSVPLTSTEILNRKVSWRAVHQYFGRFTEKYDPLVFEPHVRETDLHWVQLDETLTSIHPVLHFWGDGLYAAYTDPDQHAVSFNILDVAQGCREGARFLQRSLTTMQAALWEELVIRYLDHANISEALASELQTEPVFIEDRQ